MSHVHSFPESKSAKRATARGKIEVENALLLGRLKTGALKHEIIAECKKKTSKNQ